jgi:phage terminase large subunit GpA-like protein
MFTERHWLSHAPRSGAVPDPPADDRDGGDLVEGSARADAARHTGAPWSGRRPAGQEFGQHAAAQVVRRRSCHHGRGEFAGVAGFAADPVALARKRTGTFWNRKIVEISSPTIVGTSRIAAAYEESDQRRFHVPCPHCGVFQRLEWERVRWEGDEAATALYYCVECDIGWSDQQRWAAVRRGHWVAGTAFRGIAGFQLSELYSPWRRLAQTVGDFLEARGKPERLKVWRNTAFGLPWQEAGEAPDWERLIERREPFPMGEVPATAVALTAGVDNQNDRLELAVWA